MLRNYFFEMFNSHRDAYISLDRERILAHWDNYNKANAAELRGLSAYEFWKSVHETRLELPAMTDEDLEFSRQWLATASA